MQGLEKFGLTEGESKVYLALLTISKSTIGNIIKEANVSSSKVYEILERLGKKGLVGTVVINNRKCFEAKSPDRLGESIQEEESRLIEKKKILHELLPILKNKYENPSIKQEAELLQGFKGLKTWHEEIINECNKGDTILIIAPRKANEQIDAHLLEWHAKRIKKGVKCKLLYNDDANEWARVRKKLDLTEVRFLPKNIQSPVALNITNTSVATTIFGSNLVTFTIKNKEVAESYKVYFDLLWAEAKK